MELLNLFKITADAFENNMPDIISLSYENCLHEYAKFTNQQAKSILLENENNQNSIKKILYETAIKTGCNIRKRLRVKTWEDALKAVKIMYSAINIDVFFPSADSMIVRKCFFGNFYNSGVCKFMSVMDEGVFEGISNGGKLKFLNRITEGNSCCMAKIM